MNQIFLGVDVAGASNTWVCGLTPTKRGLEICLSPIKLSLVEIITYAEQNNIVAVAIDAQLTNSINNENGFRTSDMQLRDLLPKQYRNWVASQNSLMAVPIRGKQLADALSPIIGTILETHPRSCLYFAFPEEGTALMGYKQPENKTLISKLWDLWVQLFDIQGEFTTLSDGALDSMVCASIAYLYHHKPDMLMKLKSDDRMRTGRGPFYILRTHYYGI